MTNADTTIFDPAPPKSRFFIATLCLTVGFVLILAGNSLHDLLRRHDRTIKASWIIPALFILTPAIGLLLFFYRKKWGWYISVFYFMPIAAVLTVIKLKEISNAYRYDFNSLFEWGLDSILWPAIASIAFLLTRDIQNKLPISRKQRNWMIAISGIATVICLGFLIENLLR